MLREGFLFLSESRLARRIATDAPFARTIARRFVAGESIDDAIRAVRELNAHGATASLDYLGEAVEKRSEAEASRDVVLRVVDRIAAEKLDANVSVKLTQLGQDIDEEFVHDNTARILERADAHGLFVRFDMESSDYTQRSLDFFARMREEGHANCGVVLQSYLRRSEEDVRRMNELGVRVRLCKGAYKEPPSVAFPAKRDVDDSFVRLMRLLLENGAYPGIATHDPRMIEVTKRFANEHAIPTDRYEFQMLYGVRRDLQSAILRQGYRLRVYVPFGEAWYPYFMRRLAERPANVFFIATSILRESPLGFLLGRDGRAR